MNHLYIPRYNNLLQVAEGTGAMKELGRLSEYVRFYRATEDGYYWGADSKKVKVATGDTLAVFEPKGTNDYTIFKMDKKGIPAFLDAIKTKIVESERLYGRLSDPQSDSAEAYDKTENTSESAITA